MEVPNINFDDFVKVHLVVGEILSCEKIEKSTKLYKLSVDLGVYGKRQVLAGVAKFFQPEDLLGKRGVYVANLEPRSILGLESQGMMLFAKSADDRLVMVTVSDAVPSGTRVS